MKLLVLIIAGLLMIQPQPISAQGIKGLPSEFLVVQKALKDNKPAEAMTLLDQIKLKAGKSKSGLPHYYHYRSLAFVQLKKYEKAERAALKASIAPQYQLVGLYNAACAASLGGNHASHHVDELVSRMTTRFNRREVHDNSEFVRFFEAIKTDKDLAGYRKTPHFTDISKTFKYWIDFTKANPIKSSAEAIAAVRKEVGMQKNGEPAAASAVDKGTHFVVTWSRDGLAGEFHVDKKSGRLLEQYHAWEDPPPVE